MRYAKIENNMVTNIIELSTVNAHLYIDCVLIEDLAVQIGDEYKDEVFTRNGEVIENIYNTLANVQAEQQEIFFLLQGGV